MQLPTELVWQVNQTDGANANLALVPDKRSVDLISRRALAPIPLNEALLAR